MDRLYLYLFIYILFLLHFIIYNVTKYTVILPRRRVSRNGILDNRGTADREMVTMWEARSNNTVNFRHTDQHDAIAGIRPSLDLASRLPTATGCMGDTIGAKA